MSSFFRAKPSSTTTTTSLPQVSANDTVPLTTAMHAAVPGGGDVPSPPRPFRTPSPTPSDLEELSKGVIDWKAMFNWRNWAKRKYFWYYVAAILSIVLVALLSIFHKQIVDALTPASQYLKKLPGGWAIPIGIMFVLSFPPLFGNEIVHVLCGIVWGLWIGFGIVCAGTFIGEIGNFYAFRYCCQSRGDKLEKNSLVYATLAKVVREGGFLIAVVIRLSIIPGHLTTAVFSTCGMNIWSFSLGAFLSLPKQFATVYIGVILYESAGVESTQQKIISALVLTATIGVTVFAGHWILQKMNAAKPAVIRERRRAKALRLCNATNGKPWVSPDADVESSDYHGTGTGSSKTTLAASFRPAGNKDFDAPFNYSTSTVELPLSVRPQRWDADGRAILENRFDPNVLSNNNWAQRPPPPGAAPPMPVQGGGVLPDIRVTRASGASSLQQNAAHERQQTSFEILPLTEREQQQQAPSELPYDTPSASPYPRTSVSDEDARTPLTARPPQPPRMDSMGPMVPPVRAGRDYAEMDLYNPYDRQPQSQPQQQHRYEETDASYHTAQQGSTSSPPPHPPPGLHNAPVPGQYPPGYGGRI